MSTTPTTVRQNFPSLIPPLTLLRHAYFGSGGFQDGRYLVQYMRESDDLFARRRGVSCYINYFRPIVDSHVDPIFRRTITRNDEKAPDSWKEFVKDCTQGGMSLASFMKKRAKAAKRSGCDLIVVSAPQDAPRTAADEIENRPFVYGVPASAITKLVSDFMGRVMEVEFTEHQSSGAAEGETWRRRITKDGWELLDEDDLLQEAGTWERPRVDAPVVLLAPGDDLEEEGEESEIDNDLPRSEFYSIARVCATLFNYGSESHEIIRKVTFPLLRYPSVDLKGLTIGANNALGYPPDAKTPPDFIAPPDGPLEQIRKEREGLVRNIYQMAFISHQKGVGDAEGAEAARSGVAMRLDRESYDTALASFAGDLEDADNRIRELFGWYIGKEIDASVTYPRDFTQQDVAVALQPLLDTVLGLPNIPPTMRARIYDRVATLLLQDDAELETIREEIQGALQDETHSAGPGTTGAGRSMVPAAGGQQVGSGLPGDGGSTGGQVGA